MQKKVKVKTENWVASQKMLSFKSSARLEEISKVDNNEVSTPSDHYTQLNSKLIIEPLMTLVESLLKKEEAIIGNPKTLP